MIFKSPLGRAWQSKAQNLGFQTGERMLGFPTVCAEDASECLPQHRGPGETALRHELEESQV